PFFAFSSDDLRALRAFLTSATTRSSVSPTHAARLTLQRLNCLGCHSRDGQGGLTTEMTDSLRRFENAENAEAVSPPPLTGVGTKLQLDWMRKVLVQGGRARPWMGLRMPQFGDAHVGKLAEGLAAADGSDPLAKEGVPAFNSTFVEAGRHLVGKKGF